MTRQQSNTIQKEEILIGFKKLTKTAVTAAIGLMGLASIPTIASAATTQTQGSVAIVRNAYMISAPKLHSSKIALETKGTTLKRLSGGNRYWYHVQDASGRSGYLTTNRRWTKSVASATTSNSSRNAATVRQTPSASTASRASSIGTSSAFAVPPGVRIDRSIHPLASTNASRTAKFNAILSVAKSKLGTPYKWGHNEDRGQYGFDCSNFVEYVYHHALGYSFTTSSRAQASRVGRTVPQSDMQPGDLLIFENGRHVGIYIGNHEMIQEGGGLGKVGYLSVGSNSYWGKHITAVKRMY